MSTPILILVHPGSLCGSANANLGKTEARAVRDYVIGDLNSWEGSVLVLNGFLSDELPSYPMLEESISDAVKRGEVSGFGMQLQADDPEHAEIARDFLIQRGMEFDTPIKLTGAWYDPDLKFGCINGTQDALTAAGFSNVIVMDSAALMDDGDDEDQSEEPCLVLPEGM